MKGARPTRVQGLVAPAPKTHKTFDDDDDDDLNENLSTELASSSDDSAASHESEPDSDSEVEELTMSASRAMARQQTAAQIDKRSRDKTARQAAAQARQGAKPTKLSRRARQQRTQSASTASDEADSETKAEEDTEMPQRLDPLLFAAAFAQSGDAAARQVLRGERAEAPARRTSRARGLDGQPMTHVRGERTIVRALDDTESPSLEGEADAPFLYSALGVQRPRATARERAYKKRKLGLRAQDIRASTLEAPRAPKKGKRAASDPNDPLGLNDPALAPGGECTPATQQRATCHRIA
ncbi:hypothetical protein MNAN1_001991 [Malassezia nana]|uniref:Uncharacterized protein n=1 Tax=Malassezia nana TaxID=180528 RepID=A0AAF0ELZ6_9BASI|nr:hypothetical protein MNAN1_001991 [Malassezia nana]